MNSLDLSFKKGLRYEMNRRKFGTVGEKIAKNYLKNNGYEIIETNFYTKKGEIDIISQKDNWIVFVEIKTRNNLEYGTPAMAVNFTKKMHIKNSAKIYIHMNNLYGCKVRFDVIEIIIKNGKCKINHIKNIM